MNTYPPAPAPLPDPGRPSLGLSSYRRHVDRRAAETDPVSQAMAVRFLLETLDDPALAARVADRLRPAPVEPDDLEAAFRVFQDPAVPAQAARWLLETDGRDAYLAAFRMPCLPEAVLRDILTGIPYGSRPDRRSPRWRATNCAHWSSGISVTTSRPGPCWTGCCTSSPGRCRS